jgi:PKD repeat protein
MAFCLNQVDFFSSFYVQLYLFSVQVISRRSSGMKHTPLHGKVFTAVLGSLALAVGLMGSAWAAITVDADYTFNDGPEAGLSTFFKSGSEAPVYMDGQVTLPSNTYLMGTNLFSVPYTNFGLEVIVTQVSDTFDTRSVLGTSRGYQFRLLGNLGWSAEDDVGGWWGSATGAGTGTEYRLAIVVTNSTLDGMAYAKFYHDGVVVGQRSGGSSAFPAHALTNLMVGAVNRPELTGFAIAPPVIRVNQVRLFHFDEGQFDPATDLLTEPTLTAVALTHPVNGQTFLTGTSILARASVNTDTSSFYSVSFYLKSDGEFFSSVGSSVSSPPHETDIGSLMAGDYQMYAELTDATNGVFRSATNTFSVRPPTIVVDKQYTFNTGPEADLLTFYKSGSVDPVYSDGQVTLGPNTYLRGTNLFSIAPVDFGVEVIVTQISDSPNQHRWVLDTSLSVLPGFRFYLLGQQAWHAQDNWLAGDWGTASGVTTGLQTRLAIVTMSNPDGTITEVFYRNGTSVVSRTDAPFNFISATQSNLWVGAANEPELTGTAPVPCTIRVDEVRFFHFEPGLFSPSLLLSNATPRQIIANFSAAPTEGEFPLTVTFNDMSTPGPVNPLSSRFWDFGDGNTLPAAGTNVMHTYTNAGTFGVTLVVSDVFGVSNTNVQAALIKVEAPAASYRDAVLKDGPVAYFEMNERSGTIASNTIGILHGTYSSNAILGRVNQTFTGLGTGVSLTTLASPGLLDVPDSLAHQTLGVFSLEFWYKQTQAVVTNANHLFRPATNGFDSFFFEAHVTSDGTVDCNGVFSSLGASPFNVWHHLVVTRDGAGNVIWYLDGSVIANQVLAHYLLTPGVITSFGGGGLAGSAFEGTLDEVAIYTNVLTPARIASHRVAAGLDMPVTASFTAVPTEGFSPLVVTFTDTSTGSPVFSRFWEFGDGANLLTTTNTTVVHTYTVPGTTNTVRLTITGPLNTSTNIQSGLISVTIPVVPVPEFSGNGFAAPGGVPGFVFGTAAGFKYGLDFRDSLMTGDTWRPLLAPPDYPGPEGWSINVSTGGPMILVDTNAANQPTRYYRLKAVYP